MSSMLNSVVELTQFLFVALLISSTGIRLTAGLATLFGRRASAAIRHRIWGLSMIAVLLAPVLISLLPFPRWIDWEHQSSRSKSAITQHEPSTIRRHTEPERQIVSAPPHISHRALNETDAVASDPIEPVSQHDASPLAMAPVPSVAVAQPMDSNDKSIATSRAFENALLFATWIWLAGMIVSTVCLAWSLAKVYFWIHAAIPVDSGPEIDRTNSLCRQLLIRFPIRIVVSPETVVPFVSGLRRPVLVLPTGFGQWSSERLNVVLAHELVHVRRADILWHLIGRLCLIPAWFHPLGWIALWRLRTECEHACDDAVLARGERPCEYAHHLVDIAAEIRRSIQPLPAHVVAMAKQNPVEQRVRSILNPATPRGPVGRKKTLWLSLVTAMGLMLIVASSPKRSESKPPEGSSKSSADVQAGEKRENAADAGRIPSRVEAILNELTSLEVHEGTPLSRLLTDLSRRFEIPICIEDTRLVWSGIDIDRLTAYSVNNVPLRAALNGLFERVLGSHELKFDLEESHGLLNVNVTGGSLPKNRSSDKITVTSISGHVRDANGKPVVQATIEIRNGLKKTYTIADGSGEFRVRSEFNPQFAMTVIATDELTQHRGAWRFVSTSNPPSKIVPRIEVVVTPVRTLTVQVVDRDSSPVDGATVAVAFEDLEDNFQSVTDAQGRVLVPLISGLKVYQIVAAARGKGLDYISYTDPRTYAEPDRKQPEQPTDVVRLVLAGARPITLKVRDEEGRPIEGVRFAPWVMQKPDDPLADFNISMFRRFGRESTNQDGVVVFDWLPAWKTWNGITTFWHQSSEYVGRRVTHDLNHAPDGIVDVVLQRPVKATGRVLDANGLPVAGATVSATGAGYGHDECRLTTTSDLDGTYTVKLYPHQIYLFVATTSDGELMGSRSGILTYPGKTQRGIDIELEPSTRIFGRVTIGANHDPIKGQRIVFYQYGKDLHQFKDAQFPKPEGDNTWICPMTFHSAMTDSDGRFSIQLSKGQFDIRGPEQHKVQKFDITDQSPREFNFHSDRPDKGSYRGTVVSGDSAAPVKDALVEIVSHSQFGDQVRATTDVQGHFHVNRGLFQSTLYASNEDRSLAALIEIGPDDTEGTITIAPTATHTARVIDQNGQPVVGRKIQYGVQIHLGGKTGPFMTLFGGNVTTDETGFVSMSRMVVGAKYHVTLENTDGRSWSGITELVPESPDPKHLGDLKLKATPAPYKPPTLAERIERAFQSTQTPTERFQKVKDDSKLSHQHLLVTFADPAQPLTESLYKSYFENQDIAKALFNFRTIAISLTGEKLPLAQDLAKELNVELPADKTPILIIADEQGKILGSFQSDQYERDKAVDSSKLLRFLTQNVPAEIDARQLLADAFQQARQENKRVMIQQTATWCGPCWMLSRFLNSHRATWEKDYVWVKMDERWLNFEDVMKPIRNGAEGGIPWTAILDTEGKVLATSMNSDGENIGFPAASEPDGIAHFLKILKSTRQRMTDEDLKALKAALSK